MGKKDKEINVETYPVILWIPKNAIHATMKCTLIDDDGETYKVQTKITNDGLATARREFNEQVGDDEYYVKYVLTDKGLDMLEGLKDE